MARLEYTDDWFLTNRLLVRQPTNGFRAGTDSLLVASAVLAKPGQSVVELGAGVGTASLALASRVNGLEHCLIEIDATAASLAEHNCKTNQQSGKIWPKHWSVVLDDALSKTVLPAGQLFDWAFCNPPFFDARTTRPSQFFAKDLAMRADPAMSAWINAMVRMTRAKSGIVIICRAESLNDVIIAMDGRVGAIEIIPVHPKPSQAAINVVVRGYRDRQGSTKILPGLTIRHDNGAIFAELEQMQREGDVTF